MKNIDVEDMESYLTFYNFGFTCCKLALCCETIMCMPHVFEITVKSLQMFVQNKFLKISLTMFVYVDSIVKFASQCWNNFGRKG
jgi:hypothetical protein